MYVNSVQFKKGFENGLSQMTNRLLNLGVISE